LIDGGNEWPTKTRGRVPPLAPLVLIFEQLPGDCSRIGCPGGPAGFAAIVDDGWVANGTLIGDLLVMENPVAHLCHCNPGYKAVSAGKMQAWGL
jgi:hypothetical protein